MDDDERRVRLLLSRAADMVGPFEPPPVERLTARRSRTRPLIAVVVAVVAVVVGLSATGALHGGRSTAMSLPGPSGPTVSVSALQHYRWSALPPAPIPVRGEATSVWTGRSMIVWGGWAANHTLRNDGASYDPATRAWTKLPASPLTGRADPLSVWLNGSFVVWGGGTTRHNLSDGARYDPRTRAWTRLPSAPVSGYTWAQLVAVGDEAVLLTANEKQPGIVHAAAYQPGSNKWRALSDLRTGRTHGLLDGTALGAGNFVFLWSDWHHSVRESQNTSSEIFGVDTYKLDVRTDTWSRSALKPDPSRSVGRPIWTGRQFLLAGEQIYCGICSPPSGMRQPGVAVDPRTGKRSRIPSGPLGTTVADYYWTGSALLAVDMSTEHIGSAGNDLYPGDTAAWDPGTNLWTRLGSTRAGVGADVVTVWTGDRLLIWGPGGGVQFAPG